ncbi:MAG: hypothetical protein RBT73_00915 [Spirochaetia bacterium]|jgi:hypothetical protein|nr:hypothetical protein [Spirochaetia bacterium]
MEGLSVYLLWHNTMKRYWAREGPRSNVGYTAKDVVWGEQGHIKL